MPEAQLEGVPDFTNDGPAAQDPEALKKRLAKIQEGVQLIMEAGGKIMADELTAADQEFGKLMVRGMMVFGELLMIKHAQFLDGYAEEVGFGVTAVGWIWHKREANAGRAPQAPQEGPQDDAEAS